jgi:hypothetical protein
MYFEIKNTLKNNRYHNPKNTPHPDLTAKKKKKLNYNKKITC